MPTLSSRHRPFGALFQRLQQPGGNLKALQEAAQLALRVEFSTIPVYLTGMYSIIDPASHAYQALRAVVMEEMFHVNQAANLVVALGALPRFTGDAVPRYPDYLPHANPNTTPLLALVPASVQAFKGLYAAIESPAPAGAPPQLDHYDTIAQLYAALVQAIIDHPGNPFEAPAPEGRQRTDIYLGKFGGHVDPVTSKESALWAIEQIVRQGEGTVPARKPLVATQPFGAYNHYGQRTDGTYGPILGTPLELSHFSRFTQVGLEPSFPPTRPIVSNPREEDYSNPAARQLSQAFNAAYSVMLNAFELSFRTGSDPYFGVVLNVMHQVLPQLAQALMGTPALANGDSGVGPVATPTWTWRPEATLEQLRQELHELVRLFSRDSSVVRNVAIALDAVQRTAVPPALPPI